MWGYSSRIVQAWTAKYTTGVEVEYLSIFTSYLSLASPSEPELRN